MNEYPYNYPYNLPEDHPDRRRELDYQQALEEDERMRQEVIANCPNCEALAKRVEELEATIRNLRSETIPLALGFIEEAFPGTAIANLLRKETWSAKEKDNA